MAGKLEITIVDFFRTYYLCTLARTRLIFFPLRPREEYV
jgi:hypothetical protein